MRYSQRKVVCVCIAGVCGASPTCLQRHLAVRVVIMPEDLMEPLGTRLALDQPVSCSSGFRVHSKIKKNSFCLGSYRGLTRVQYSNFPKRPRNQPVLCFILKNCRSVSQVIVKTLPHIIHVTFASLRMRYRLHMLVHSFFHLHRMHQMLKQSRCAHRIPPHLAPTR